MLILGTITLLMLAAVPLGFSLVRAATPSVTQVADGCRERSPGQ